MKDQDSRVSAPRIKWLVEPTYDDDGVQRTAGIDSLGREHGDPTPLRPPIGLNVGTTDELHTALKAMLVRERAAFKAAVEAEEFESEEDANDFAVYEDLFPPGNEAWEDIHEFPADPPVGNRSEAAASQRPPNGQSGASDPAAQPVISDQISSADLHAELKRRESLAQKPISSAGVSTPKASGSVDK